LKEDKTQLFETLTIVILFIFFILWICPHQYDRRYPLFSLVMNWFIVLFYIIFSNRVLESFHLRHDLKWFSKSSTSSLNMSNLSKQILHCRLSFDMSNTKCFDIYECLNFFSYFFYHLQMISCRLNVITPFLKKTSYKSYILKRVYFSVKYRYIKSFG